MATLAQTIHIKGKKDKGGRAMIDEIRKRLEHRADSRWGIHAFNDNAPADIAYLLEWCEKLEVFTKQIRLIKSKTMGPGHVYDDFGPNLTPEIAWELTMKALTALEEVKHG